MRHYQELVVPGIGGVGFVRQLSWAVAGLYLAPRVGRSPIEVANAIEALGCKLEYHYGKRDHHGKRDCQWVRGVRAFGRHDRKDGIKWLYKKLRQGSHYVQAPYRMSTTRALPEHTGLGLTDNSGSFRNLQLNERGEKLASAFLLREGSYAGKGRRSLKTWLSEKWIGGEDITSDPRPATLLPLLSPCRPSQIEKKIVRNRLYAKVSDNHPSVSGDGNRRQRLLELFKNIGDIEDMSDIQGSILEPLSSGDSASQQHAKEIDTALKLELMRDRAIDLLSEVAGALGTRTAQTSRADLCGRDNIKTALGKFRDGCRAFQESVDTSKQLHCDAQEFAAIGKEKEEADIIDKLVMRDGRILTGADDYVTGGPAFSTDFGSGNPDDGEDDVVGASIELRRPQRLFQFFTLAKDADA